MSIPDGEIYLGINIDHVATLRQARGTRYPEPLHAALVAQQAGADLITVHLREDRRHIRDADVEALMQVLVCRLNLEMAVTAEMLAIATRLAPPDCCLVPERREELTTEGGLDVASDVRRVAEACSTLAGAGIRVSLFVDPEPRQLEAAAEAGAPVVELHTGRFADAPRGRGERELARLVEAARVGESLGLQVNAGHGLHYHNVEAVAGIPQVCELNIGHAVVSRAVFTGLGAAVSEMKALIRSARRGGGA